MILIKYPWKLLEEQIFEMKSKYINNKNNKKKEQWEYIIYFPSFLCAFQIILHPLSRTKYFDVTKIHSPRCTVCNVL